MSRPLKIILGLFVLSIPFQVIALKGTTNKGTEMKMEKKETSSQGLTEFQKYVTKHNGTEPPFKNEYWDNHEDGIYVDVSTGDALFSSLDKYDSGTGWPSFSQPLVKENILTITDSTFGMERTEVRSKPSDSHLGHVFKDGPAPNGERFCMNSAALKFIPAADLEKSENIERYGKYAVLFKKESGKEKQSSQEKDSGISKKK